MKSTSESTDVPAGAAHQQQARANQQQPERMSKGHGS